jgi:hypothetical protein
MCRRGLHPWIPENLAPSGQGKFRCKQCKDDRRDRPDCSVEGCPDWARIKGWCHKHYGHWRAHGDPLYTPMTGPEMIAEIEWLLEGGMGSFYVAEALHRDRLTIARLLNRHKRYDLAARFERVDDAA